MNGISALFLLLSVVVSVTEPAKDRRPVPNPSCGFLPNRGQWPEHVTHAGTFGPVTLAVEARALSLSTRGPAGRQVVRLVLPGQGLLERQEGSALPGVVHLYGGGEMSWRTGLPRLSSVTLREPVPGVDLRVRDGGGHPEYDLLLTAGASLESLRIQVEGAVALRLADDGALVIQTAAGDLRQPRPIAFRGDPSDGEELRCEFALCGDLSYGFRMPDWDRRGPAVIDPPLVWSTFVGGTGLEAIEALGEAPDGGLLIGGTTSSFDFPGSAGSPLGGAVFVSKLRPDGTTLEWSALFPSSNGATFGDLSVDPSGTIHGVGFTVSADFPVTASAWQPTIAGGADGFAMQLGADGRLRWSSFLGGSGTDRARAVGTAPDGSVLLAGETGSTDFPTLRPFDRKFAGITEGFVTCVDRSGAQVIWSTYLGGDLSDSVESMAVAADGSATLFGMTASADLGGVSPNVLAPGNLFLARLAADGRSLRWASQVGGGLARGMDVAPNGDFLLAGMTGDPAFPVSADAADRTLGGAGDGFVSRVAATGDSLLWATFVGGSGVDSAWDVSAGPDGLVAVVGSVAADMPTTPGALSRQHVGFSTDGFIALLDGGGTRFLWSSYLGGGQGDEATRVLLHVAGSAIVGGFTASPDFPVTPGAFDPFFHASFDATLSELRMQPLGTSRLGTPTRGCAGAPTIHAVDDAVAPNPGFGIACTGIPPGAPGWLVVGTPLPAPIVVLGAELWIDLSAPFLLLPRQADAQGESETALPLGAGMTGLGAALQYLWREPGCTAKGFSASDALMVQVQ